MPLPSWINLQRIFLSVLISIKGPSFNVSLAAFIFEFQLPETDIVGHRMATTQ
jgi:hypothetical protein